MRDQFKAILAGSALAFTILDSSAVQAADASEVRDCKTLAENSRQASTLGYLRLVDAPSESTTDENITEAGGNGGNPVGYSRLWIQFRSCADAWKRLYPDETRDFLKRYFMGKQVSKILGVKATIDPTDVSKNLQLILVKRDSTKRGDMWRTEVTDKKVLLPYFLVDNSTVISMEFSLADSSTYESSVAGGIIEIAQKAAEAINPASTLITTENKDRFNKASSFIDGVMNGLLRREVAEILTTSFSLPLKRSEMKELSILILSPPTNKTIHPDVRPVGIWTITAENLARSIFGDPIGDRLDSRKLSAPTIINYRVSDSKTLGEALAERPVVITARDAYLEADASKRSTAGSAYCKVISNEVAKIGFTPVDVGAAVWAAASLLPTNKSDQEKLMIACSQIDFFPINASSLRPH